MAVPTSVQIAQANAQKEIQDRIEKEEITPYGITTGKTSAPSYSSGSGSGSSSNTSNTSNTTSSTSTSSSSSEPSTSSTSSGSTSGLLGDWIKKLIEGAKKDEPKTPAPKPDVSTDENLTDKGYPDSKEGYKPNTSTGSSTSTNTSAQLAQANGQKEAKRNTDSGFASSDGHQYTNYKPSESGSGSGSSPSKTNETPKTDTSTGSSKIIGWPNLLEETGIKTKPGNGIDVPDYSKPIIISGNLPPLKDKNDITTEEVVDAFKNLPGAPKVSVNDDPNHLWGEYKFGTNPAPIYTDPKTGELTSIPGIEEHLEAEKKKEAQPSQPSQPTEPSTTQETNNDWITAIADALDGYYKDSERFNGARSGIDVGTAPQGNIYTGLNGDYYGNYNTQPAVQANVRSTGTPLPLSTAPAVTSTFQPNPNFNVNSVMPNMNTSNATGADKDMNQNTNNTGKGDLSRNVSAGHTSVNIPTVGSEVKDTIAQQQKESVAPGGYGGYAQDKIKDNGSGVDMGNLARNNTQATYDYLNNVADINTKLRNDISNEANNYIQGVNGQNQNYTGAMSTLSNTYRGDVKNYMDNTNQYIGNQGYQNALKQAQRGAVQAGYNAASTAQAAARNAGMSKAAAAAMGAGNAINGYTNALNQQQQMVQNNYNNALNTYGNQLNAAGNVYGQQATAAGNRYGQSMGALNNSFATNANTMNSAASNMNNALGQDIVNRQNQYTNLYGNQDAITKLLKGFEQNTGISGLTNGSLGWLSWLVDPIGTAFRGGGK